MTDSYQAIYDAVRSRISNGDVGQVVSDVARSAFDLSHLLGQAQSAVWEVAGEARDTIRTLETAHTRPSVLYRPKLFPDGHMWCALYGEDLQSGVAGFGASPAEAMAAFDSAWAAFLPPKVTP